MLSDFISAQKSISMCQIQNNQVHYSKSRIYVRKFNFNIASEASYIYI